MTIRLIHGDCVTEMRKLPEASVDAVVCDPPYGLEFMGKDWDSHASPVIYQEWCEAWAFEAFRVLKPGGHLVSFGGSRTYHRLAAGVEDAGFEIRDQLQWLYGSGFPKSLDVSKAIDKLDASDVRLVRARVFQAWLAPLLSAAQVSAYTGTTMGHHLTTHPTQPEVATADLFDKLRPYLPEVPSEIEVLVAERTVESENFKRRAVVGVRAGWTAPGVAGEIHRGGEPTTWSETSAHTPDAEQWQGWGTALKPAHEPIVLARKPLIGTVARNVLEHGTGALNIDGTRIGTEGGGNVCPGGDLCKCDTNGRAYSPTKHPVRREGDFGRWPANVILDEEAGAILDAQTGTLKSGVLAPHHHKGGSTGIGTFAIRERTDEAGTFGGDSGGASRFFYCAKTSKRERNSGNSDNRHPTVKPVALMAWLCRLVTPPGGVILDPFVGSGSTCIAAIGGGFSFIGIDQSAEYLEIARRRIQHAADELEDA